MFLYKKHLYMTNFVKINVPVFLTKPSLFLNKILFSEFFIERIDIMISWREWTTLGSIPRIASCSWARGISASLPVSWDYWLARKGCRTDGMSPSPATRLGEVAGCLRWNKENLSICQNFMRNFDYKSWLREHVRICKSWPSFWWN
jgi:hypothetical protein